MVAINGVDTCYEKVEERNGFTKTLLHKNREVEVRNGFTKIWSHKNREVEVRNGPSIRG